MSQIVELSCGVKDRFWKRWKRVLIYSSESYLIPLSVSAAAICVQNDVLHFPAVSSFKAEKKSVAGVAGRDLLYIDDTHMRLEWRRHDSKELDEEYISFWVAEESAF
jgi:hypothetical protein